MLYHIYKSPFGLMQIQIEDNFILQITMNETDFKSVHIIKKQKPNIKEIEILKDTIKQLDEYFEGKRYQFLLPLKISTSIYAQKVYEVLLKTKYGKTYSYKDIAILSKNPRASRAVGTIMKNNNFAIVIPCHRVIKSNGEIGEYFSGSNIKEQLINFEGKNKK